jgi:hypothetical protein
MKCTVTALTGIVFRIAFKRDHDAIHWAFGSTVALSNAAYRNAP